MVAVGDGCRGGGDGVRDVGIEQLELGVRVGRGQLDQRERPDEPARETLARDREVEDGTLRLGAVQGVGRDGHLAHRVALDTGPGSLIGHAPIVAPHDLGYGLGVPAASDAPTA